MHNNFKGQKKILNITGKRSAGTRKAINSDI